LSSTEISIEFPLADQAATEALAARLAAIVRPGDVLALWGDLGTGKTVFARAFIRAWSRREEEVPSPTFTLVQTYDGPGGTVYHFDMYRLTAPDEAYELDIEDAFAEGISLIEWPDRLGPLLPAGRLDIRLGHGPVRGSRTAALSAPGAWNPRMKEAGLA